MYTAYQLYYDINLRIIYYLPCIPGKDILIHLDLAFLFQVLVTDTLYLYLRAGALKKQASPILQYLYNAASDSPETYYAYIYFFHFITLILALRKVLFCCL